MVIAAICISIAAAMCGTVAVIAIMLLEAAKQNNKILKCKLRQAQRSEAKTKAEAKEAGGNMDMLRQQLSEARGCIDRLTTEATVRENLIKSLWKQVNGEHVKVMEAAE